MTGAPPPLPRIPSGQWGHHLPGKPVFIRIRGRWLVMGTDDVLTVGARVWAHRFRGVPVLVLIGEPKAEHLNSGVRYVACEFQNIGPRGCYGNE